MTVWEPTIELSVESDPYPGGRNQYRTLESVRGLARSVAFSPEALTEIGVFASYPGQLLGYDNENTSQVRRRLMMTCGSKAKESVRQLEALCEDYAEAVGAADADVRKIIGFFTSAVLEEIVALLLNQGRDPENITEDACFKQGKERLNNCNVDFTWAIPSDKTAELHECKTDPRGLFHTDRVHYTTKDAQGNERNWRRTKLWLMLRVRKLLLDNQWKVRACCITMKNRSILSTFEPGYDAPPCDELSIYCLDDLMDGEFPPPIPS